MHSGADPNATRIPSLGPRGEGWVLGQAILLVLVVLLGAFGLDDLPPTDGARWLVLLVGLVLLAAGLLLGLAALRTLGSSLTPLPRPKSGATLTEAGVYGVIRHPMYVAVILCAIGWAVAMASAWALVAAGVLAVWFDLKARREEAWLVDTYPGYAAYRERTGRFLPRR